MFILLSTNRSIWPWSNFFFCCCCGKLSKLLKFYFFFFSLQKIQFLPTKGPRWKRKKKAFKAKTTIVF